MMKFHSALLVIFPFLLLLATTKSQDFPVGSCGDQAGGALCAEGFCCSKWGWCGTTSAYCDPGNCQSQCPPPPSPPPPPPSPPPPPPSPPPPQVIPCGIDHGGAKCPIIMCCTVWGYCSNAIGPFCSRDFCQSHCGAAGGAKCGVNAGGAKCKRNECCTKAGFCAPMNAPSCRPPFCQNQCPYKPTELAKISMFKAIA